MKKITFVLLTGLLGSTLVLASGCASPFDEVFNQDRWRTEEVADVLPMSDLEDSVNRQCLEKATLANTKLVALIKIRVNRAPHQIAMVIPSSSTFKKKDKVRVDFDTCEMQLIHAAQPGSQ